MASKYHLKDSSLYIEGTDIPKNRLNITNAEEIHELERELIEEAYINASIECVQFADCAKLEKIVFDGLYK